MGGEKGEEKLYWMGERHRKEAYCQERKGKPRVEDKLEKKGS